MGINYRLGLDLGTNSIGWAIISLDDQNNPDKLIDGNSFIFSNSREPKSKVSLAVARREARQARRQRDRYLKRKKQVIRFLIEKKLFPDKKEHQKENEKLDPYKLRFEALERPLTPFELGRVLFALNQRRGYKPNRKDDKKSSGKNIKILNSFESDFRSLGYRSLGEYFWKEKQTKIEGDINNNIQRVYGVKYRGEENDPFPYRHLYEEEFDLIQLKQGKHHLLSDNDWDQLRQIIYYQRPLRPIERGYCSIYYEDKEEKRAYKALPSAEKFRVLQELNNLRIITKKLEKIPLTIEQKNQIFTILKIQKNLNFSQLKKKLKLEDVHFNLESKTKKKLDGLQVNIELAKSNLFSDKWGSFSEKEKNDIVVYLLEVNEKKDIEEKALNEWGLPKENAIAISNLDLSKFPSGTIHFCQKALEELNELMETKNIDSYEAIKALKEKVISANEDNYKKLPYYGYIIPESLTNNGNLRKNQDERNTGIIGNPTVHVGLNNIRKVVNKIIDMMGCRPTEINLEIARELKMNREDKKKFDDFQTKNETNNKKIKKELEDLNEKNKINIKYNYDNRLKYKLWQELGTPANCVYTGKAISRAKLYSPEIEVEHILPITRTHDDSPANKTLAFRSVNKQKDNQTPFEAFGHTNKFEDILNRIQVLPKNKQWRFAENAMERYDNEFSFLKRQLHDTQYLSKIAHKYLSVICDNIRVVTGQLTAKLRHDWGIEKYRTDHRHHFMDAVVIGLTDTRTIQMANIRNKNNGLQTIQFKSPINDKELRSQIESICKENIVFHQKKNKKNGLLHEETNYGVITNSSNQTKLEKENGFNIIYRKELTKLTKPEIQHIRDIKVRTDISEFVEGISSKEREKEYKKFLVKYGKENNIKRVRILKKDVTSITITHNGHTKQVVPGNVHHIKLWKLPDGKIQGVGVTLFDVNQSNYGMKSFRPKNKDGREIPTAKYLMKIQKGDIISLIHKKSPCIGVIRSLKPSNGCLMFTFPHEINNSDNFKSLSFSKWNNQNVKLVKLNVLGKPK